VRGSWTIALANFFLADRPAAPEVWHFGPTGRDCGADLAEGPMEAGATWRGHLALPVLDAPVPSQIAYAAGGTPASWKLDRA